MHAELVNQRVRMFTPYAFRDTCVSIPGGRWNKAARCWEYPYTPASCLNLIQAFPMLDHPEIRAMAMRIGHADIAKKTPPSEIPIFKGTPWAHQKTAYHFSKALSSGSVLALDMGTGKTRCNIDYFNNTDFDFGLVVCPNNVLHNFVWPNQIDLYKTKDYHVVSLIAKSVARKTKMMQNALFHKPAIGVINYESVWREPFASFIEKFPPKICILDESHRIKSPGGKASKFFAHLAPKIDIRGASTGTPAPHSPLDLYGQARWVDPGIYGTSFSKFRSEYCVMGGYEGHQVLYYINQEKMKELWYRIAYRVEADDVQELPPFEDRIIEFDLEEERKIYDQFQNELYVELDDRLITADNALVKLLRLQQVTSGHIDGIPVGQSKRKVLADIFEDFAIQEPLAVYCRFHADLDQVRKICMDQGRRYVEVSGRAKDLHLWQRGDADVVGIQIQSGAEGIDLTRGRFTIYFSLGYSLGDYTQSRKRMRRPGQTEEGIYFHILARNTVDQKIMRAYKAKQKAISAVLDQMREEYGEHRRRLADHRVGHRDHRDHPH